MFFAALNARLKFATLGKPERAAITATGHDVSASMRLACPILTRFT
jgi:hypothetical protein